MTVPTRRLGTTSIESTRMALGLAALGRPAYINAGRADDLPEHRSVASMATRTHAVLDAARASGIRAFDAARSYGQAENFLADWLSAREIEPGQVSVSSKWGYTYVGDWRLDADCHEVKSHDLPTFGRQWPATRKILWSHLDLYQVHSLTVDAPVFEDEALLDALLTLEAEHGVTVGATVTGPAQAEAVDRIVDFEHRGSRVFRTVQATFNLLEPSVGPALARAHASGLGVIVKEGLANGRLAPGRTDPRTRIIAEAAEARGTSADALALAAILTQPWADVVLSGAVTEAQVSSNVSAFDVAWDDDAESLFERMAESPADYWSARSRRAWG
jgi:aryl-alcohol dehydrogenase-like predicted oxidoreductase